MTVVPLMALERFGSAKDVSIFFFVLGILGVGMSLAVPWLVRHLSRRGTFWLGIGAGVAGMLLFIHNDLWFFLRRHGAASFFRLLYRCHT